ncbi:MAG TPA: presqualene diphosphate synthase HpnD [Methylocystis sp.]|nr:presqualene diphosphate synthase HpnD [Methylocystis sp.]
MTLAERGAATAAETRASASGSSFYLAMRVLAPERRDAMFAIYAFCRAVDDIADDEGDREDRRRRLDEWRRDLDELYAGRIRRRCAQLAEPVRRFHLDRADFESIIDGMQMDVDADICAPDWETLDLYCERVASAVGRLSVRAFGFVEGTADPLPENARALAHCLGRALQLTNVLRDLDEDAARGRLYLPREELLAAGVADLSPAGALASAGLATACAAVAERARKHFAEANRILAESPRAAARTPALMAAAYESILDNLLARGFAPPRQKVHASRLKILLTVLRYAFA